MIRPWRDLAIALVAALVGAGVGVAGSVAVSDRQDSRAISRRYGDELISAGADYVAAFHQIYAYRGSQRFVRPMDGPPDIPATGELARAFARISAAYQSGEKTTARTAFWEAVVKLGTAGAWTSTIGSAEDDLALRHLAETYADLVGFGGS